MPFDAHVDSERVRNRQRVWANNASDGCCAPVLRNQEPISLSRIEPVVTMCKTGEDIQLFEYCRLSQRVPSGRRIGRQIRSLVFDVGQLGRRLIGAIGLASPMYALACRDAYLEWSGSAARARKEAGLRRLMDLHLCIALPPYSAVFGGKLLAALALSDSFNQEFRRRYDDPLLAVTTSCATGLHCPILTELVFAQVAYTRR